MSILNDVKKCVNIEESETVFDEELIIYTNSVLWNLNQINIGPEGGVKITNDLDDWAIITDRLDLEAMKLYVGLKVRLIFDPPSNSFTIEAIKAQIKELEVRLNTQVDIPVIEEVVDE